MGKKVIKLTENDLRTIVKRVIKEQDEDYKANLTIQCFLNKKGIKDSSGKPLVLDGKIGRLPNSKTAQAIVAYQAKIGADEDGVWGYETGQRMPSADVAIFKQCASDNGDIIDKALHWLGID